MFQKQIDNWRDEPRGPMSDTPFKNWSFRSNRVEEHSMNNSKVYSLFDPKPLDTPKTVQYPVVEFEKLPLTFLVRKNSLEIKQRPSLNHDLQMEDVPSLRKPCWSFSVNKESYDRARALKKNWLLSPKSNVQVPSVPMKKESRTSSKKSLSLLDNFTGLPLYNLAPSNSFLNQNNVQGSHLGQKKETSYNQATPSKRTLSLSDENDVVSSYSGLTRAPKKENCYDQAKRTVPLTENFAKLYYPGRPAPPNPKKEDGDKRASSSKSNLSMDDSYQSSSSKRSLSFSDENNEQMACSNCVNVVTPSIPKKGECFTGATSSKRSLSFEAAYSLKNTVSPKETPMKTAQPAKLSGAAKVMSPSINKMYSDKIAQPKFVQRANPPHQWASRKEAFEKWARGNGTSSSTTKQDEDAMYLEATIRNSAPPTVQNPTCDPTTLINNTCDQNFMSLLLSPSSVNEHAGLVVRPYRQFAQDRLRRLKKQFDEDLCKPIH